MKSATGSVLVTALWMIAGLTNAAWAAAVGPNSVPEPTSLALLAVGLGGAAWAKFRRRK